jgi:hypothetical protein
MDTHTISTVIDTQTVPKASPDTLLELSSYLAPFAPLFRRSTSRESLERYITGSVVENDVYDHLRL